MINLFGELHHDCISSLLPISLIGSVPIDGIFVSPQLQHTTKGDRISINEGIDDHLDLFIDLLLKILLGENTFHIHRHTARRLICEKLEVVEEFNILLRHQMENQFTIS